MDSPNRLCERPVCYPAELLILAETPMALPWLQIVQLIPSILDVSRELLRKTSRPPTATAGALTHDNTAAESRIAQLEENERRQAELINQMAEQLAALTRLVTVLHQRVLWLAAGLGVLAVLMVVGLVGMK
ncbi:MAG TPA: hypothetical protein VGN07_07620 [Steroidobacteraceae bacterium]|jgi:uncharacterized coiled-coil protein SlyX